MNRLNHTLFAWLLFISSIIYISRTWLSLPPTWRIVSLCSVYIGSFFLIMTYTSRSLLVSRPGEGSDKESPKTFSILELFSKDVSLRLPLILIGLLAVVYMVATSSACFHMTSVNDIYPYIVGWGVICLIFDSQIKSHMLKYLVEEQKSHGTTDSKPAQISKRA